MTSQVKHYTGHSVSNVHGPITVVSGKKRRLTLMECPNDLNAMCDIAKTADLILLLIDGSFGFEMETFEFLNVAQTHGFPKVWQYTAGRRTAPMRVARGDIFVGICQCFRAFTTVLVQ